MNRQERARDMLLLLTEIPFQSFGAVKDRAGSFTGPAGSADLEEPTHRLVFRVPLPISGDAEQFNKSTL